jgi:hypothetical protein
MPSGVANSNSARQFFFALKIHPAEGGNDAFMWPPVIPPHRGPSFDEQKKQSPVAVCPSRMVPLLTYLPVAMPRSATPVKAFTRFPELMPA